MVQSEKAKKMRELKKFGKKVSEARVPYVLVHAGAETHNTLPL